MIFLLKPDPRLTDYDTLLQNVHDLKAGKQVQIPIYDFKSSSRTGYRTLEVPSSRIVIIEGIHALSEKMRPLLDLRVSVTGGIHFDLVKRVLRDIQRAGQEPEEIIQQISETVYPMYKAFIEPDLGTAHIKITNKFNPFTGFQSPTYILKSARNVTVDQIKAVITEEHAETMEEVYDIYLLPPGEDPESCQSYLRMRNKDGKYSLMFEGCRIWRGREQAVKITHLLFADDTIVFCEAKKEALLYLGWILFWFEAASGLKINLDKSMVILVGEVEGVLEMAAEIGCRVGQLPTVYLGLPLGAPNRASSAWDGVEERMRRRLALWKRQYLSKGGRITLIKSTLSSVPLYQMSVFRMPKSVARRIEKLQRNFLWGGANGGSKVHLVRWEVVCADKDKGGLGLRKITLLNKALLGKWIWRFACAKEELWKKVLEAKYGKEELGWRTRKANGAFGVGVWKEILKEST
ncbi:Uridine-cytidine kinase C [Vitis vinifera]|uniref:Uridine-cytidine kinase C n=1 Tax=Vitis vinifera TaxID=29760 RepID=A0A438EAV1_VITVI|nr:Uridine-cytidine kinase C [Vitis vinifera]